MAKNIAILGFGTLISAMLNPAFSQTNIDGTTNTLTTAVPFLTIAPDARSGSMGDVGVAVSPDANAQYWNMAKLVRAEKDFGIGITYTPWLQEISSDIFLGYISGFAKVGEKKNQTISASLRYFNLGNIQYMTDNAQSAGEGKPREYSLDIGYSSALSENLSLGVTLRYIHSNIAAGSAGVNPNIPYEPANAVSADIGLFYTKTNEVSEYEGSTFNLGAVLRNLGPKISYAAQSQDFLPGTLAIGGAYTHKMDAYNTITAAVDIHKILAPTAKEENGQWTRPTDPVVSGIFKSFSPNDAPPGYGTKIAAGAEYWYQNQFAIRAGYFYENPKDGARQYFTCGVGVRFMTFGLDVSYLVPSGSSMARNPLANTLRFSLLFDMNYGDELNFNKKKS